MTKWSMQTAAKLLNSGPALAFLAQVVMAAGKIIFVVLVSQLLGLEAQGFMALALAYIVTFGILLSLGAEVANASLAAGKRFHPRRLAFNSAVIAAISVPVGYALISALAANSVAGAGTFAGVLWLISILVGAQVIYITLQGIAIGQGNFANLLAANAAQALTANIVVILIYVNSLALWSVLLAWLVGLMAKSTILLRSLGQEGTSAWRSDDESAWRAQIRLGSTACIGNLASAVMLRMPVFQLSALSDLRTVGAFSILLTLAEAFLYLPKALANYLIGDVASERVSRVRRERSIRLTLTAMLIGALSILALAPPVLLILVPIGVGVVYLTLLFLLLAVYIYALGLLLNHMLYGLQRTYPHAIAAANGAFGAGLLGVILIPQLGSIGAGISFAAGVLVYTVIISLYMRKAGGLDGSVMNLLRPTPDLISQLRSATNRID